MWWIIIFLHLAAAIFTAGNIHPDEYFQILEMGWYRAGLASGPEALTWEYASQIRSGLAPWVASRVMLALPGFSPGTITFVLRLLASALGCITLYRLWKSWQLDQSPVKKFAQIFFVFTWFLPLQHARFSSESLSGAFFFIPFALIVGESTSKRTWMWLISGLLLGLSFQFRYQAGFLILGFLSWLLIRRRPGYLAIALLTSGLSVSLGIGAVADHWLYGQWTLTPWNFFRVNLIEGKAAEFGTSPWWDYFRLLFLNLSLPPWSLALMIVAVAGVFSRRGEPLAWSIVPFFVVHSLIGHKELRFLYPLASAFPLALALGAESGASWLRPSIRIATGKITIALSIFLLTIFTLKPVRLLELANNKLERLARTEALCVYSEVAPAFFRHGLPTDFLRIRSVRYFVLPHGQDAQKCRKIFYRRGFSRDGEVLSRFPGARLMHRTFPEWMTRFNVNGWMSRAEDVELWELPSELSPSS